MGVLTLGPMIPSLVAQSVKNLPAVQETRVPSLGWEDPLEEEMATHSSILARKIPRTEEPGGLYSLWDHRVGHDLATTITTPIPQTRAAPTTPSPPPLCPFHHLDLDVGVGRGHWSFTEWGWGGG